MVSHSNKILCIGDNSSHQAWAHNLTLQLAESNGTVFRGQFANVDQFLQDGYYHTDLVILNQKELLKSINRFDKIILLDQDIEKYSHPHVFVSTWKLVKQIKNLGHKIQILNDENMSFLDYWDNLTEENKSFCLYPWVKSVSFNNYHTLCTQSYTPVTKLSEMKDWKHDPNYKVVRKKMLQGEKLPNCNACYEQEQKGKGVSIRKHETLEWAALMHLKSVKDLYKITSPSYFELRFSNKCNIKCRSCSGHFSHLIRKENIQIKDTKFQSIVDKEKIEDLGGNKIINWHNLKRVYIGGGESTVQPELYQFLRNCIANDNTNFELRIGTNGVKISKPLLDLLKHFSNLTMSLSIDGTPKVDEYIRWGTDALQKQNNVDKLLTQGHPIAINFVLSIWNIGYLGETLEYFEKKYPNSPVHMNVAGYRGDILSPYIFPNKKIALRSIMRAKETKIYHNNEQRTKQLIDSVYNFYSNDKTVDLEKLNKFFYYNDTLDKHRGSRLSDYIPALEECRKYLKESYL